MSMAYDEIWYNQNYIYIYFWINWYNNDQLMVNWWHCQLISEWYFPEAKSPFYLCGQHNLHSAYSFNVDARQSTHLVHALFQANSVQCERIASIHRHKQNACYSFTLLKDVHLCWLIQSLFQQGHHGRLGGYQGYPICISQQSFLILRLTNGGWMVMQNHSVLGWNPDSPAHSGQFT